MLTVISGASLTGKTMLATELVKQLKTSSMTHDSDACMLVNPLLHFEPCKRSCHPLTCWCGRMPDTLDQRLCKSITIGKHFVYRSFPERLLEAIPHRNTLILEKFNYTPINVIVLDEAEIGLYDTSVLASLINNRKQNNVHIFAVCCVKNDTRDRPLAEWLIANSDTHYKTGDKRPAWQDDDEIIENSIREYIMVRSWPAW